MILPRQETEKDWFLINFLFIFFFCVCDDLFTMYYSSLSFLLPWFACWELLRHSGGRSWGVILNYSLLFFLLSFFVFPSFCRVNMSLPVSLLFVSMCYLPPLLSLSILLFSESQAALLWLHDVRGGRSDSSSEQSLDQERAGNNLLFPSCSVLYCLPLAVTLPSLLHLTSLCHHLLLFVFLSVSSPDPNAVGPHGTDHALIGGVVAVVVFVTLCLIIVLGRYLARHKGKTTVDQTWVSQGAWS